ncbi:MAG: hypothetical protein AAFP76_06375 [Bacteroidota bacterium]
MNALEAPKFSKDPPVKEVLNTEIGKIYFYDHIVVMEAKENIVLSIKTGIFILLKGLKIVGTRPIVYISNRVNAYSVDPNDYKYLELIPNLKGIAIVSYNPIAHETAKLEKQFFKKPFKTFDTLDAAKEWALEMTYNKT